MDVYDAQRGPFNKDWNWLFAQPSAPSVTLMAFFLSLAIGGAFIWTTFFDDNGLGAGNTSSIAQMLFRLYIRLGIFRNALFRSCDRQARKYQLANTCQIPHFKNLSDIYSFIFGYKANGLFVGMCVRCCWHLHFRCRFVVVNGQVHLYNAYLYQMYHLLCA